MLQARTGLTLLIALVFVVNYVETALESWLQARYGLWSTLRNQIADAVFSLEGYFSFEFHDMTSPVAVYGYSISYFFLFPLLFLALAWALARRETISGYRTLALAVATDYLVSLPFFLFFPVPERWAYPDASAILLSDRWDVRLISAIRPLSGLDNCFPSSHVSLTVIMIAICWLYRVRLRTCFTALGLTIILGTYVLGIHWLADIGAGIATAAVSVAVAVRIDARLSLGQQAPAAAQEAHVPAETGRAHAATA